MSSRRTVEKILRRIITKFRATGIELKRLKDQKESLLREINVAAPKMLTKIPMIEYGDPKENNLQLKDEIWKRFAQIQITFQARIFADENRAKRPVGIRPGKGQIVVKVTFVNGAFKLAFIDALKAALYSAKVEKQSLGMNSRCELGR